jgi:hypothetical protein
MIEMRLDIGKAKASRPREGFIPNPKLKLLDQVSEVMRFKHYSLRTERTYREWIKRFKVRSSALEVRSSPSADRGGYPHHPGAAGPQRCLDHDDLHACAPTWGPRRVQPAGRSPMKQGEAPNPTRRTGSLPQSQTKSLRICWSRVSRRWWGEVTGDGRGVAVW